MFPFDMFPFPQAWVDAAPETWAALTIILVAIAIVLTVFALIMLIVMALYDKYQSGVAQVAFAFLGAALVLAAFGPWLWVFAGILLALYLVVYWVLWRIFLRNAWVALFGND